ALEKGLTKIELNEERIAQDVDAEESWEVVSEAIQTMLRRYGYPRPYEALKELTRGRSVDQKRIQRFIESLDLKNGARDALKKLAPRNYTGLASKLVELYAPAAEGSSKHRPR